MGSTDHKRMGAGKRGNNPRHKHASHERVLREQGLRPGQLPTAGQADKATTARKPRHHTQATQLVPAEDSLAGRLHMQHRPHRGAMTWQATPSRMPHATNGKQNHHNSQSPTATCQSWANWPAQLPWQQLATDLRIAASPKQATPAHTG